MKWTAEADLVVGVTVGSGRRKLGIGFGIGRKKIVKRIGVDLTEELLRRCCLFYLKDSGVSTWNWSVSKLNSIHVDRDRAMKRSNVINLLLQMMPSSVHAAPVSPDHWSFLEEVDAPQWADLEKEAALMGTLGDDPWFYRSHNHHETSLAREVNVPFAVSASKTNQTEQKTKSKIAQGKGNVSKLIKPSLKANAVKACLGGMHRVSNAGSKEGRLSLRPRVTLSSTGLPRPRTPKKVHIQRPAVQKKGAAAAGSDSRLHTREMLVNLGTPGESFGVKIVNLPGRDQVLDAQDVQTVVRAGIGRSRLSSDLSVTGSDYANHSSDLSVNGYESPKPSLRLYPLPSPPNEGDGEISADGIKSSPSDMIFSSDSSPESTVPARPSSAALVSKRKIFTPNKSHKERVRLRPGEILELPTASLSAANCTIDVEVNEPILEISSFKESDRDLSNGHRRTTSTMSPRWNQPASPRLKRRSLGPALRVKQIEKLGSSSVKKKGSTRLARNQDAGLPDKFDGSQASHPILEKLRKSWGSALRVKQRRDAEVPVGDTRGDDSGAVEQKVGSVFYANNDGNLRVKKLQPLQVQTDVVRPGQPGGAAVQSSEVQVRKGNSIFERQFIYQPAATDLLLFESPRRTGSSVPTSGNLSQPKSMGTSNTKPSTLPAAKSGLAKVPANSQRPKYDCNSKFKKQYAHPETGVSQSLNLKGNKENMNSEMHVKAPISSQGLDRKRKMQISAPRSVIPTSGGLVVPAVGAPPAALPAIKTRSSPKAARSGPQARTSPQARNAAANKTGPASRPTRTIGQEPTDSSGQKEESDKKQNNLPVTRAVNSSLLKPTKQKPEKIPAIVIKGAATTAGPKGCKNGVKVADESAAATAEDRKSRVAPSYEPRLHSSKAIKEWETKSGRRYYDLQPSERQKVNQQITAATKRAMQRSRA